MTGPVVISFLEGQLLSLCCAVNSPERLLIQVKKKKKKTAKAVIITNLHLHGMIDAKETKL